MMTLILLLSWFACSVPECAPSYYADLDGDGFGAGEASCDPTGVSESGDCDDQDPLVHPGTAERCNGADDNCDAIADDGLEQRTWFVDADGDGHGDPAGLVLW